MYNPEEIFNFKRFIFYDKFDFYYEITYCLCDGSLFRNKWCDWLNKSCMAYFKSIATYELLYHLSSLPVGCEWIKIILVSVIANDVLT